MGENVPTHVITLDAGHYGCMEHNWAPGNGYSDITRGRTGTSEDMSGMASGGDRGTRTPNLRDANAALSHLSYIPAARATGGSGGRFTIGPGRRHGQGVGPSPPWPWPSAAPPAPTAKPPLPRDPSGWPSRHQPFAQPRPHSRAYGRLAAWAAASGPRLTLPRSSVVEQSAVNRLAVGSSPTAGANSARRGPSVG